MQYEVNNTDGTVSTVVMPRDDGIGDLLRFVAVNEELLDDLAVLGELIAAADAGPDEEQSQEQRDEAVRNQLEVIRRQIDGML